MEKNEYIYIYNEIKFLICTSTKNLQNFLFKSCRKKHMYIYYRLSLFFLYYIYICEKI